jgi:predicted O-methyltransferase YrrM
MEYPNWFEAAGARKNFEFYLNDYKGKPHLKFLQVGVYTGDASVWLLDNILTDESSLLVDVDTWEGSNEAAHKPMDFNEIYELYKKRVEKYSTVQYRRMKSLDFLRYEQPDTYDFIYIDGDHTATGVLLDAELSWDLLKSGGILAFDDFEWNDGTGDINRPMPGINAFLDRHKGLWAPVHKGWQLWVSKR